MRQRRIEKKWPRRLKRAPLRDSYSSPPSPASDWHARSFACLRVGGAAENELSELAELLAELEKPLLRLKAAKNTERKRLLLRKMSPLLARIDRNPRFRRFLPRSNASVPGLPIRMVRRPNNRL